MATVALFGGSFNPPHVAHVLVTSYVLATCDVDEVWWLPTYKHVFGKALASFDDRVQMCELAVAELGPRVGVKRYEQTLAAQPDFVASRTFDLLHLLGTLAPGNQFRLIIGADILHETAKWHRWDDVAALAPPIVIGRGGVTPPAGATVTELAMPTVSSTDIRARIGNGAPVNWLLPRQVLEYIASKGLYR